MAKSIAELQEKISNIREQIVHHPLYASVNEIDHLQLFMQYHVYAVWDFMSLLKSLQNNLTCTRVPWWPVGDAATRFLINEIVVGEESDVDMQGKRMSHFEMYLEAMKESRADTSGIIQLIDQLKEGNSLEQAWASPAIPEAARQFMQFTFKTINSDKAHIMAAVFTFGREDLIPGMFMSMVRDMDHQQPGLISKFKYYLERHIEVDGDHHSHLALQMTELLCGEDSLKWQEASEAVLEALQMRKTLWDAVYAEIKELAS